MTQNFQGMAKKKFQNFRHDSEKAEVEYVPPENKPQHEGTWVGAPVSTWFDLNTIYQVHPMFVDDLKKVPGMKFHYEPPKAPEEPAQSDTPAESAAAAATEDLATSLAAATGTSEEEAKKALETAKKSKKES